MLNDMAAVSVVEEIQMVNFDGNISERYKQNI